MSEVGDGWVPGLPAPFQPSFGLIGALATPIIFNRDPFTLEEFDKDSDERTALFEKMVEGRVIPALLRLIPNNPLFGTYGLNQVDIPGTDEYIRLEAFNSWSHKRLMKALTHRRNMSKYSEDMPVSMAIMQSISVKLWPWEEDIRLNTFSMKINKQIRDRENQIKKIHDTVYDKYYNTPSFNREMKDAEKRIEGLEQQIHDIVMEEKRARALKRKSK